MLENALKRKYRYPTNRGEVTTEDLYDTPLTGAFSLDTTAQTLDSMLTKVTTKSFVVKRPTDPTFIAERLEIVKSIISFKLEAQERRADSADKKIKREKLLSLLSEKEDDEMKSKSKKSILKELEALED